MNERIKELADQAGWIYVGNSRVPNMEKFAELLLQEAIDAIVNDSRLNDVRSAANGCVRTIREHFGVDLN